MENLTENQIKNKMRKIAKEYGLKLKFENLSFGTCATICDQDSALDNNCSVFGDNPIAQAFLTKLAKLRSNDDFKALTKMIDCYGLKNF